MSKSTITLSKNKKGTVTKVALGLLLVGGGLIAITVAPGLGMALKLVDPNPRKAADKLERALRRLIEDGSVEKSGHGNKKRYRITPTGEQKLARLRFAEYTLPKPKKWSGVWWVVCFDIPEVDKYVRTTFQTKLSSLGFYRLQNSVFVHPYPCKEFIALANQAFGLEKCVRLIAATNIDNEPYLLKFFQLRK